MCHKIGGRPFPRPLGHKSVADAQRTMADIGVGGPGCAIMGPKSVFRTIRLSNVPLKAAMILKQEMLAKGGEAALPVKASCLCIEECPVILTGTVRQYQLVTATLRCQPFGLRSIADEIDTVLGNLENPPAPSCVRGRTLDWGRQTYIMGILNVTPDSFSDGGKYVSFDAAIAHARSMIEAGAHIIDVGGESTRPGSLPIGTEEELRRVAPVVEWLSRNTDVLISVDTYRAEVARECLRLGAHIINDITALRDEGVAAAVADAGAGLVLMHMKGTPSDMQRDPSYDDVVGEVYEFLHQRLCRARELGVHAENCIVDPGIGFGKTVEHNLELLRHLQQFSGLGVPILVGTSRKSTVAKVTGAEAIADRVYGTAATVALAVAGGADIVRVHDVREMAMVVRMTDAIVR
ncbi:MAG: dihydropteroate synthase [Firmicutes bacterium]|jgi:dihydropteroate synthase|nr:dihydropteroate synthase [Bacillota bacterium]